MTDFFVNRLTGRPTDCPEIGHVFARFSVWAHGYVGAGSPALLYSLPASRAP